MTAGVPLERRVMETCRRQGWALCVAESCTGGLLGGRLTAVPGSSDYFLGGVIAYSNDLKISLLDVSAGMLDSEGAVSKSTAEAMARGAVGATGAHCGISVTGVAGPLGGTPGKPVGTVWVSVVLPSSITSRLYTLPGDRQRIREQAVRAAMELFLEVAEAH